MITGNFGGKAWVERRLLEERPNLPSDSVSCSVTGVAVIPGQRRVTPPGKRPKVFSVVWGNLLTKKIFLP